MSNKRVEETEEQREAKRQRMAEESAKIDRTYCEYRQTQFAKTPFIRAHNMNLFKLVWQMFTNEIEPPEDIKQKAQVIQMKYFEKHPEHLYCDPILFKEIVPNTVAIDSLMRIVIGLIQTDRQYASYGK
jgi:hypothetical protein